MIELVIDWEKIFILNILQLRCDANVLYKESRDMKANAIKFQVAFI